MFAFDVLLSVFLKCTPLTDWLLYSQHMRRYGFGSVWKPRAMHTWQRIAESALRSCCPESGRLWSTVLKGEYWKLSIQWSCCSTTQIVMLLPFLTLSPIGFFSRFTSPQFLSEYGRLLSYSNKAAAQWTIFTRNPDRSDLFASQPQYPSAGLNLL